MDDHFQQLVGYIQFHLGQGVPEDHIRQTLLQHHWDAQLIDKAFLSIRPPYPETAVNNQPSQNNTDTNAPKKYKVFRAIGDTFKAIKNNAAAFILSVIFSYVVAGVSLFAISFAGEKVLYGEYGLLFASTPKLLAVLFGSLILYTAWYAFAGAFTLSTTSLALYEGSEGRKSSISSILSHSFSRLGRVVLAEILFCLVAFWPIVLIIFLPLMLLSTGVGGGGASLILMPVLVLAAIIWIYIALLRFALAPFVALFEPNVPIRKTLGRSKHLLQKGGQWFLIKGFLLILLLLIIMAIATGQNLQEVIGTNSIAINIVLVIVSILINGVLAMLYRNRKITRG